MKPWRSGGTQTLENWDLGARPVEINELQVGDILLRDTPHLHSHYLCRVVRFDRFTKAPRDFCCAIRVDPNDPSRPLTPGEREFVIWGRNLVEPHELFYRATRTPATLALAEAA